MDGWMAGESGVISLTAQCANRQSSVVQPHQSSSAPDSVNISPSASAASQYPPPHTPHPTLSLSLSVCGCGCVCVAANGRPDEPREMGSFSSLERPKMRTLLPMDVLAANKMQQREGRYSTHRYGWTDGWISVCVCA